MLEIFLFVLCLPHLVFCFILENSPRLLTALIMVCYLIWIDFVLYHFCPCPWIAVSQNSKTLYTNCRWPLNNTGSNCVGPLTRGLFSVVNTAALQGSRLAESTAVETRYRAPSPSCMWAYHCAGRPGTHDPHVVQGSTIFWNIKQMVVSNK